MLVFQAEKLKYLYRLGSKTTVITEKLSMQNEVKSYE